MSQWLQVPRPPSYSSHPRAFVELLLGTDPTPRHMLCSLPALQVPMSHYQLGEGGGGGEGSRREPSKVIEKNLNLLTVFKPAFVLFAYAMKSFLHVSMFCITCSRKCQ